MLSQRYIKPLCALLALAALPIVVHVYLAPRVEALNHDDCANPAILGITTPTTTEEHERDRWMRGSFGAIQWRESEIRRGRVLLSLTTIRSYNAKELYYRAERSILKNRVPVRQELVDIESEDGASGLPVRRIYYKANMGPGGILASYLLIYEGRPVENPYRAQLLAAPRQIFTGRVPMPLYFVYSASYEDNWEEMEDRHAEWLRNSWQEYREFCSA